MNEAARDNQSDAYKKRQTDGKFKLSISALLIFLLFSVHTSSIKKPIDAAKNTFQCLYCFA
jgi:hypothetical protein